MSAIVIDGKATAAVIRAELKEKTELMAREKGFVPGLCAILVGEDPASKVYVRNKIRACEEIGFYSRALHLPAETDEDELLSIIREQNADPAIHGILVQLPLPKHIDERRVLREILPAKDVDGFHVQNMGALTLGEPAPVACTPTGCMELLLRSGVELTGKRAVVVGRSNIVGKPMALLLLAANCTVTVCHSKTQNLPEMVRSADILIAAVGRPAFIRGEWIKEGAAVIDVGINRLENGKLCGDVEFEAAKERAGCITPVPGGVGPMTIAMLMRSTFRAAYE